MDVATAVCLDEIAAAPRVSRMADPTVATSAASSAVTKVVHSAVLKVDREAVETAGGSVVGLVE